MSDEGSIIYRGMRMKKGWPELIRVAQAETAVKLQGRHYQRLRYGSKAEDWPTEGKPCGDCGVIEGEFHVRGCDIERCPRCAGQLLACDCNYDDEGEDVLD